MFLNKQIQCLTSLVALWKLCLGESVDYRRYSDRNDDETLPESKQEEWEMKSVNDDTQESASGGLHKPAYGDESTSETNDLDMQEKFSYGDTPSPFDDTPNLVYETSSTLSPNHDYQGGNHIHGEQMAVIDDKSKKNLGEQVKYVYEEDETFLVGEYPQTNQKDESTLSANDEDRWQGLEYGDTVESLGEIQGIGDVRAYDGGKPASTLGDTSVGLNGDHSAPTPNYEDRSVEYTDKDTQVPVYGDIPHPSHEDPTPVPTYEMP